jgi:hypothetical protein
MWSCCAGVRWAAISRQSGGTRRGESVGCGWDLLSGGRRDDQVTVVAEARGAFGRVGQHCFQ